MGRQGIIFGADSVVDSAGTVGLLFREICDFFMYVVRNCGKWVFLWQSEAWYLVRDSLLLSEFLMFVWGRVILRTVWKMTSVQTPSAFPLKCNWSTGGSKNWRNTVRIACIFNAFSFTLQNCEAFVQKISIDSIIHHSSFCPPLQLLRCFQFFIISAFFLKCWLLRFTWKCSLNKETTTLLLYFGKYAPSKCYSKNTHISLTDSAGPVEEKLIKFKSRLKIKLYWLREKCTVLKG